MIAAFRGLRMKGQTTSADIVAGAETQSAGLAEFDDIYRRTVGPVTAYFARRSTDPQTVADLTSETFERAAGGFGGFDSDKRSARAWVVGLAAETDAEHVAGAGDGSQTLARLPGDRPLAPGEVAELAARIDAERAGRETLERCARLPALERAAIELVDLAGLTPEEAAAALGVYRAVLRVRLARARARLHEEDEGDE